MQSKRKKKKTHPRKAQTSYFSGFVKVAKVIGLVMSILATLAGLYFLRPKLMIAPGVVMNPADPFSTTFEVNNVSEFLPMQDMRVGCDGKVTYIFRGSSGG